MVAQLGFAHFESIGFSNWCSPIRPWHFGDAQNATCLIPVSRPHDYATAGRIGLLDEGVDQDFQIGDQSTFSYSMGSINTIV